LAFVLLAVACCSSCFEDDRKAEKLITLSVIQFHEQLSDERYQDIYSEADAALRGRVSEADFTAQLSTVHAQLGKITSKPLVSIKDTVWRSLRQTFGPRRDLIPHFDWVDSETAMGDERFVWALENDQATLVSYEFRFSCKKPCGFGGFGPSN